MASRRPLVLGADGFPQALQVGDALVGGLLRYANATIPAGNTVTAQTETAFASKMSLAASALAPGFTITLLQWGLYSSTGVTPSITPRIRLGGTSLLPARSITGLLGDTNQPWQAASEFLVTDQGIAGTGMLFIADNVTRIFGSAPVTGIALNTALDLTSSAQWGQAGCSITCQGWVATVTPPSV